jgi:glutamate racemase
LKKIGVFDSGIGGLSVAKAIEKGIPEAEVVFVNDVDNMPYGSKSSEQLLHLVRPKMRYLYDLGCDIVVIACNTVTTNIIKQLRAESPIPLVGIEPMVKPAAALTKTRMITVCATPATLASDRYVWLKTEYAKDVQVLEPDCSDWSNMIESDSVDEDKIRAIIDNSCENGSDVIVLGCTHYHWIEDLIKHQANGRATVIQPESAIVARIRSLNI